MILLILIKNIRQRLGNDKALTWLKLAAGGLGLGLLGSLVFLWGLLRTAISPLWRIAHWVRATTAKVNSE